MHAEREPLVAHQFGELASELRPYGGATRRVVSEGHIRPGGEHAAQVSTCLGDVARPDRPPLNLVRVEEADAAPALEHGGELPREVDRVADAGVHAEAA